MKFKIGDKVILKNSTKKDPFFIAEIRIYKDAIHYYAESNDEEDGVHFYEDELELIKEKKKVTLWAPIFRERYASIALGYYCEEKIPEDRLEGKLLGWHSIEVEIESEPEDEN